MNFNEFKILHSEVVMYCQLIEHDLKLIYSHMHKGNIDDNYDEIDNRTLGQMVAILKKLDNSNGKPDISAGDYNFLKQMTEKRNYWCHKAITEFIYNDNFLNSNKYAKVYEMLVRDNQKLKMVCNEVEKIRIRLCNDYQRRG